jgi:hypothetical protein
MQNTYNIKQHTDLFLTQTSPGFGIGIFAESFEGIRRPEGMLLLRDSTEPEDVIILERYFSDIQNLFLKKLSAFAISDAVTESESTQLRALLEEMLKVKQLIQQRGLSAGE